MFKKKTIDSVLAVAQKVVTDLQSLAIEHQLEADRLNEEASALAVQADDNRVDSERAIALADKWAELV